MPQTTPLICIATAKNAQARQAVSLVSLSLSHGPRQQSKQENVDGAYPEIEQDALGRNAKSVELTDRKQRVMELNLRLSPSQAKFALWLEQNTPYLLPLFDFEGRVFREDKVEHFLGVASHGQAIMARFVLGVWLGRDGFDFDFTDAASVLDRGQRKVITDWILDPFWP